MYQGYGKIPSIASGRSQLSISISVVQKYPDVSILELEFVGVCPKKNLHPYVKKLNPT